MKYENKESFNRLMYKGDNDCLACLITVVPIKQSKAYEVP